jgi:outer membrane protein TolC
MKIRVLKKAFYVFLFSHLMLFPQLAHSQDSLNAYVQWGLNHNVVVLQKQIELEKAQMALKIAKSYFLPSVQLNMNVSTAEGGRYADLPLGDMLNPVYSSLNQLTSSNSFPQIENQSIQFLPKNYYDAYVRTSMPLYNPVLKQNKKVEASVEKIQAFEIDIYKRDLVKAIKDAYYDYQILCSALEIYESSIQLLKKNLQVNESLFKNGKGLQANVIRAEAELETIQSELNESLNKQKNAQAYLNFLMNRDLNTKVHRENNDLAQQIAIALSDTNTIGKREELNQLETGIEIHETLVKLNQSKQLPSVNAFLDLGSQAVEFEVSNKSLYYMVGVNLSVPIYSGSKYNIQVKQSERELKSKSLSLENTTQAFELSLRVAINDLNSQYAKYISSIKRQQSAQQYFNLIEKGFAEGIHSLIEYLDARNQLTRAQLQLKLDAYNILKAGAALERQQSSFKF